MGKNPRGGKSLGCRGIRSMLKDLAERRWENMEKERQVNEVMTLIK